MRVIEEKMVAAVSNRRKWKCGNTEVRMICDAVCVFLHGHMIYCEDKSGKWYSLAGWDTNTTRSRLRALGLPVYRHKGETLVNGVIIPKQFLFKMP